MAKELPSFPDSFADYAKRTKHNYKPFLDGKIYELKRNVDFHCEINHLRSTLHRLASKMGKTVRIHKVDEDTVIIQSENKNELSQGHTEIKEIPNEG